ncbi:MAG: hypothetical protein PUI48_01595 [Oscillospiraceae bacterium]|nr:hypothetical protein [Oscillospiraceae bacterium]MDY6208217.1 DUF6578 domain-containing protein [Oscillospiraceae bacterium]
MKCIVFYESWQLECCGTPFSIGDSVKWLVDKTEHLNTPVDVGTINYCYEAHSKDWQKLFVLEGKVETIKILYELFRPSEENPRFLIAVDGKMIDAAKAEGFDKDIDNMKSSGYIVLLNECTIRPAKKEEVTFQ